MADTSFIIDRRAFCSALASAALISPARAAEDPAAGLMQSSYLATRFANARFTATLTLRGASGSTQRRNLSGVAKLIGQSAQARLIRISAPADMAGVATLTIERGANADDLWIYLPAMRRVRRLVTSNRADPWVGSDFSFGDILGHKVGDWHHEVAGSERLDDGDAWQIDSRPASVSITHETGYGRRRSWVRKSDFALLRCDFYSAANGLIKSAAFSDFRTLDVRGGKVQPMVMAMHSVRRGTTSVMRFSQFSTDQAVPSGDVTPEALNR